jgi:hypothetical protein
MRRLLLFLVLLAIVPATPALAAGPLTMSYQGVLMNDSGDLVPDGPYTLTFRIYDVPSGGSALWTEVQPGVAVSRGGFSVVLGSITPIPLPFDAPYYLGIQVGASAELAPRVRLASSPYAMSVWVPGATLPYDEARLSAFPVGYGDGGGYLHLLDDATGAYNFDLEPRFVAGGGAYMHVRGGGYSVMMWDGAGSGGAGTLVLDGPGGTSYFHTGYAGDAAVVLPTDAISSAEILDEPGIAQSHNNGGVDFYSGTSAATVDILSVSLTIPAAGYIVLTADAQFGLFTASATAGAQITAVSGGATDWTHYFYAGGPTVSSGTVIPGYVPVSIHRTYYEAAAGTYTFYFQAWNDNNATWAYAWSPTFTALYVPTSYGSVATAATAADLPRFESVTPTSSAGNGPGRPAVSGALVDLRELELRATQARLRAEQAERQLLEARLAGQSAGITGPATTKQP